MTIDTPQSPLPARTKLLAALAIGAMTFVLAGCGAEAPEIDDPTAKLPDVTTEGFEGVSAELDFASGTAITPISRYLVNQDFTIERQFEQAREALISECMSAAGFSYAGFTGVDWATLIPQEDRIFGMWDRASAAQFGVDLNPNRGTPKATLVEEGPEFNTTLNGCADQAMQDEALGPLTVKLSEQTLADRILGNATNLALQSADGKAANEAFASCLADKSIVVDPASGYPSGDYIALGKEAEIESVLAEVDCNIDSGRIETLYNLRAQYESAYIKEYESQLATVLDAKEADSATLQEIIERHQ